MHLRYRLLSAPAAVLLVLAAVSSQPRVSGQAPVPSLTDPTLAVRTAATGRRPSTVDRERIVNR